MIGAAEIGIIFGGSGDFGLAGNPAPVPGTAASGSPSALWMMDFDSRMAEYCMKMERAAGLKSGCLFETAAEMTATLGEKAKESLMPFLMTNSLPAAAFFYTSDSRLPGFLSGGCPESSGDGRASAQAGSVLVSQRV